MKSSFLCAAFCLTASLFAQTAPPPSFPELQPLSVKFSAGELPLQKALEELHKQTGNQVADRRSERTNPKLTLPPGPCKFWEALDLIGKENGLGFSAYQHDGDVAWVDTPYRPMPTSYSGLFRFAVKRVGVGKDEETQAHLCIVGLDIAWEPRFQPLYLNLEEATVSFQGGRETLQNEAATSVAGACAAELDLRMKAPPRKVAQLDSLRGKVRVLGPAKMLDFRFAKLKEIKEKAAPLEIVQEGHKVSLTQLKREPNLWTVDLLIEIPKDAGLLGSFQSWMLNNRIWLEWTDPKTNRVLKLETDDQAPLPSPASSVKIRFYFRPQEKTLLPPSFAAAALHYRTPNRMVAFSVPFDFAQGIALP